MTTVLLIIIFIHAQKTLFQSIKKESLTPDVWFIFQKSKYVYDWDKKQFHTVDFPDNKTYEEYMESKGYVDDESIDVAEKEYGKNEMIMVMYFRFFRCFISSLIISFYFKESELFHPFT